MTKARLALFVCLESSALVFLYLATTRVGDRATIAAPWLFGPSAVTLVVLSYPVWVFGLSPLSRVKSRLIRGLLLILFAVGIAVFSLMFPLAIVLVYALLS